MDTEEIKETIMQNSAEVLRLHTASHEAYSHRNDSDDARRAWILAGKDFSERFLGLAFPGGYEGALARLVAGDALAMEAAICFLELRPYFFHSGFMFKDLLRKSRKAPLSAEQRLRLQAIEAAVSAWRANKRSTQTMSASQYTARTMNHA